MKRRSFIKFSSIALGTSSLLTACKSRNNLNNQKSIKSFIVSDAHIGWRGKDQPTIDQQSTAINNITKNFKNLDLAFDTGDVHHGYLNENERVIARTEWLNHIANPFSNVPFHYIPGNHELGKGFMDPELIACSFGSIPHRPYYAFDYMGIHFISLPQLQSTILISKESINWLKLNLELNKLKTTIILSHNSLKGTTFDNNETGYRCITNTDELNAILNNNPQIKAWFHGHNHHYEVTEANGVIHVSNGRIGGFNPPPKWGNYGQGHLGGIYFEIDKSGISVKAYSASKGQFLDQLGYPNLSLQKKCKTSFDPTLPFNYYSGNGNTLDRMSQSISQNYVSKHNPQLVYTDTDSIINDNSDLAFETKYFFSSRSVKKIIGYKISNRKVLFHSSEEGLTVSNPKLIKSFYMSFPTQKNKKNGHFKRGSYFRTQWEQPYQLVIDIQASQQQLSQIKLETHLFKEKYEPVEKPAQVTKTIKENQLIFDINTGRKTENANHIYMYFKLFFEQCFDLIRINKIQLSPLASPSKPFAQRYLDFNGDKHLLNDLKKPQLIELKRGMGDKHSLTFYNKTSPSTCFVLKQPAIEWQIRNGTGYYIDSQTLQVNPQSDHFNNKVETIITPTARRVLYVNKVIINKPIKIIFVSPSYIKFSCKNTSDLSQFTVYSSSPIKKIIGAKVLSFDLNLYLCQPTDKTIDIIV